MILKEGKLRQLRLNAGMSQTKLALESGVARNTISRLESGKRKEIYRPTVFKLSKALGCEATDLVVEVTTAPKYYYVKKEFRIRLDVNHKALREYRRKLGWTQACLAEQAGIAKETVWALENTRNNMRLYTAQQLANALGCKVEDIATEVTMRCW